MNRGGLDSSNMLGRIEGLASQCLDGWEKGLRWAVPSGCAASNHLLILGMGGSAIGADLLKDLLRDRVKIPIAVNRSYTIPRWVSRRTFVLACSYSGNTEETLSAARQALQRGARLAAISSGGKLAQLSRQAGFPLLRIPAGIPPRAAVGYALCAPLGLLVRLRWVEKKDLPVEAACSALDRFIRRNLGAAVGVSSNPAKKLARQLFGKLPVLYGASPNWEAVTYRWRTQLEENGKVLTFHHLFPEATHNEISGWVNPPALMKKIAAVFLTDQSVHPRTLRRMEFTRRIIQRQGARTLNVRVSGESILERTLKMIALGDFVSLYLALLYRVDPTPVERVEALKKWLR